MSTRSWVLGVLASAAVVLGIMQISAQIQAADEGGLPQVAPGHEVLPGAAADLHPVRIHLPIRSGQARTGEFDSLGRTVTMECSACHAERDEPEIAPAMAELDSVHTGLQFAHGNVSCFSCHDPDTDYEQLKLADGTSVEYADVMDLCSQCHGPQRNDYDHGAHGGMTGSWDLTRGPRDRNSCTVCHDPHLPAFPHMRPTFKPLDRFLTPEHPTSEEVAHGS